MMPIFTGDKPVIRVHYIEDNLIDQQALTRVVQKKSLPYQIDLSSSLAEARSRNQMYDLVICDYFLSDGTILDLLPSLDTRTPVIVVTGQADLNNAVTALKLGAKDYLVKDPERQYLNLLPIQIENLLKQQQNERDRKRLSSLLFSVGGAIPFGVYLYEPITGTVMYANKAFFSIWDFDAETSESLLTHDVIFSQIKTLLKYESDDLPMFSLGEDGVSEIARSGEVRVQNSKTIRYYTDRIPMEPGDPACYVSIFEDSTALSQALEAVNEYSRKLEHLNTSLDQQVQERTEQLEGLMQKQRDLIVNIGHDLRTPLTPLVALLPYLQHNEADEEKKNTLGVLCESTMRIRTLVEEILMMDNLGVEKSSYSQRDARPCDLGSMADEIIEASLSVISSKGLSIRNAIQPGMLIRIRYIHLHLILEKLINNALQFTPPGGTVTLHGGKDHQCTWFCVSDTGIGLTHADSSRIFDDFYKADASRSDLLSHGLGLSVVRKLVLLNHGHITVKSDGLGMGTRFCVSLPDCTIRTHQPMWD
ncbi:MAG TPA: ATP-binding protein [Methanospirillum sp.]|uniref:sensor histidine kinase n=1 Tax=Methanospirillum sp. TaxID=45200 RepID=UPI002C6BA3EB|nr:ATP-binding protein [Methanospirillum sp.]HWQ62792.1 ATP-binding protein [Methanospirillum sp.]